MSSDRALRALAVGGLFAVLGDILVPFLVGSLQPGYDPVAQYMSELGVPGRRGALVLDGWWTVSGALFVGFAFAIHRLTASGMGGGLGPLAIAAFGLFTGIGSGLFPCDEGCVPRTTSGELHEMVNVVGAFAQLGAPGLCWIRWRRGEVRLAAIARVALVVSLLGFALFLGLGETTHGQPGSWAGLYQRVFQGTFYAWLLTIAVELLRRSGR